MKRPFLNGLFCLTLLSIVWHYGVVPKDTAIDHSREVSLQYAIDAFQDGYPLYSSNQHVYEALCGGTHRVPPSRGHQNLLFFKDGRTAFGKFLVNKILKG